MLDADAPAGQVAVVEEHDPATVEQRPEPCGHAPVGRWIGETNGHAPVIGTPPPDVASMTVELDDLLTPRLRLRRWRPEDAAPMAAINSDPEVTRYLNRPADPRAVAEFHGRVLDHWERYGFGWFALESREPALAGRLLGFAGVAHPSFLPEVATRPELGWRLGGEAWGRGLATEAAVTARDHAFGVLMVPELIAIIHPDNERSRRVATKLGMTVERPIDNPTLGRAVELWQMPRPRP